MIQTRNAHVFPRLLPTWLLIGLIAAAAGFTTEVRALAQEIPVTSAPKTDDTTQDAKNTSAERDALTAVADPRATLITFLEAATNSAIDYDSANLTIPTVDTSSNEAVRKQIMQRLQRLLSWQGWTVEDARRLVPGSDFKGSEWLVFPFASKDAPELTRRSEELNEALNRSYQLSITRTEDGRYLFSANSLNLAALDRMNTGLQKIKRETGDTSYDSVSDWVHLNAPNSLLEKFLFLEIWQWIGLAIVIFLGFAVDFVVRLVLGTVIRNLARRYEAPIDEKRIKQSVRGFGLLAGAITWLMLLAVLGLPLETFQVLQPIARFLFIGAIAWCLWRIVDLVGDFFIARARSTETKLDDVLVPMIRKTGKVLIVVFALVNLAPLLGLDLGPLLAAIGIGTLGLSFAFKNTLENFFGSVTVILDRPFQVGDWVVCDGIEGTVESVGMRSTRIRTFYNSLVTMPNSALITNEVDNYGLRKYRRWSTRVGVTYDTPPERIDAYCEAIREVIRQHPYTRKDYYQIWLNAFGDSALEIMVYLFWEAPDWQTELRERHRFMLDIISIAAEMDVEFAFPTQTIHLKKDDAGQPTGGEGNEPAKPPHFQRRDARQIVRSITENAEWKQEKPPKYRFTSAEETAKLDAIDNQHQAAKAEQRLEQQEQTDLPPESGTDPDNPDFIEQRDAGGG